MGHIVTSQPARVIGGSPRAEAANYGTSDATRSWPGADPHDPPMAPCDRTGKLLAMSRPECYVTDGADLFRVLHPLVAGVVALENAGTLELLLMSAEQVGQLRRVRPVGDAPHPVSAPGPRRSRPHPFHALRRAVRARVGRRRQTP